MGSNVVYIKSGQEFTSDILKDLINSHLQNEVPRLKQLYEYYKGNHAILERKMPDTTKPNNKLVNNFYGQIVDDVLGYFLGIPVIIQHNFDDDIQEQLDIIFNENDKDDLFMEIGKEMSIKGKSAILIYQDENSRTRLAQIPAEEVIFIYDNSKPDELLYAIRVYELEQVQSSGEVKRIRYVEVYDKHTITYYIEDEGGYVLDNGRPNPVPHIFEDVPIVPFFNNKEEMGDFEKIITLVNDYDRVISDASNEQEAFRNAYLVLINMIADKELIERLKQEGILALDEDGDAKFLTKNIQTDALENHLNRLEENIYRFAQIPNLSDEKFAHNLSGVAIKFKLFSLENKCIIKERKMVKSIKKVLKLLAKPIKVITGKEIKLVDMNIRFTRNVPANLLEVSQVVTNLNGLVDKHTLLSLLPFVDDPDVVLELIQKEAEWYNLDLSNYHPIDEEAGVIED